MELTKTSASQVKDFRACERLWFYKNVLQRYPPATEAMRRGTIVHGALEAYLKGDAVDPEIQKQGAALGITQADLDEYVAAIKPLVGTPGEGVTEYKDVMNTYEDGPGWTLIVDHACTIEVPGHGEIPQIEDLKTTSDFRYCKTPAELATDTQMISYAKWALRLYEYEKKPPPDFVSLRHVYVRTRGKRIGQERSTLVTPDDVDREWEKILGDVRRMVQLAEQSPDPMTVTPNTESCSAYGGCFFRTDCFGPLFNSASTPLAGLFTLQQMEKKMSNGNNVNNVTQLPVAPFTPAAPRLSLTERMKMQGGAPAPAPAAAPTPPAPVAPVATCGSVCPLVPTAACGLQPHTGSHESRSAGGVMHWSDATGVAGLGSSSDWKPLTAAAAASAPAPLTTATATGPASTAAVVTVCGDHTGMAPEGMSCILVPHTGDHEGRNGDAVAHWNAGKVAFGPSKDWKPIGAATPAVPAVLPPDASSRISTAEEVAAANAPKIKRKKAEAAAPAQAAPAAQVPAAPAQAAPAAQVAAAPAPTVVQTCALQELFIDCWPIRGSAQPGLGEDLIAPAARAAAEAASVPDYRFISYTSKGALAAAIRANLGAVPAVLVVTSSSPGSDALLEVLMPYARRVVRAMRG